jgi:hypothetical protein
MESTVTSGSEASHPASAALRWAIVVMATITRADPTALATISMVILFLDDTRYPNPGTRASADRCPDLTGLSLRHLPGASVDSWPRQSRTDVRLQQKALR